MNCADRLSNIEVYSVVNLSTWSCTVFTLRLPRALTDDLSGGRERCIRLVEEPFRIHVNFLEIALRSWERQYSRELSTVMNAVRYLFL